MFFRPRHLTIAVFSLSLLAPLTISRAAPIEWVGQSQVWDEPTNWEPNGLPANDADVLFGNKGETTVATNRGNRQANSITFSDDAAAYTFTGGNFVLTNNITTGAGCASEVSLAGIVLKVGEELQVVHQGSAALILGDLKNTVKDAGHCSLAFSGDGSGSFGSFQAEASSPFLVLAGTGTWIGTGTQDFRLNVDAVEHDHSEITVMAGMLDISGMTLNIKTDAAPTDEEYLVVDYSVGNGAITVSKDSGVYFKAVTGLPGGYELKHDPEAKQILLVKK